jgi:hypothetical protein
MPGKFNFRVHVSKMFFDRVKVQRHLDTRTRKVFARFGAYVRQTAKASIKRRKGTSMPGRPPHSHVGTLKRHIYFSYDPKSRSVVIGPVIFPGKTGKALPALEYGGKSVRNDGQRINVKARPFMGPAFREELKQLPSIWANIQK